MPDQFCRFWILEYFSSKKLIQLSFSCPRTPKSLIDQKRARNGPLFLVIFCVHASILKNKFIKPLLDRFFAPSPRCVRMLRVFVFWIIVLSIGSCDFVIKRWGIP